MDDTQRYYFYAAKLELAHLEGMMTHDEFLSELFHLQVEYGMVPSDY